MEDVNFTGANLTGVLSDFNDLLAIKQTLINAAYLLKCDFPLIPH